MKLSPKLFGLVATVALSLFGRGAAQATPSLSPLTATKHPFENGCFLCNSGCVNCPPPCCSPTGWTVTKAKGSCYCFGPAHPTCCGTVGFNFGATCQQDDILSQSFTDVPGPYTLAFCWGRDVQAACCQSACNHFEVLFDGNCLLNATNFTTLAFRHSSFCVNLTGCDTVTFRGYQLHSFFDPTHITFTPAAGGAPEVDPASARLPAALALSSLLVLADCRRRLAD